MALGKVIKADISGEPVRDPSRSSPRPRPPGTVLDAEVYEAHQVARQIVEAAQRQAEQILNGANREKERVLSEGRNAGRQEGLAV
ncbi:MAG TPA: flagellar assembly protein FliH, partial [Myxococcaceae bacterium]|nr:flagellar assembly protein FliH [Myxococcaceae bacterium]